MKEIITKYLEGRASRNEQTKLFHWIRIKQNNDEFRKFRLEWKKSLNKDQLPAGSEKSWNFIQSQISNGSYNSWQKSIKQNLIYKVAAIFFFAVCLGGMTYFIVGNNNKMPKNYTTVFAGNGQISMVQLPDGSFVWLNSGSQISYSGDFASDNRDIELSGEAFFKVVKNDELPLVVSNGDFHVKVLGTEFNIAAYPDLDKIDVVLESGKVELLNSNVESFSYQLKPGERATFDKTSKKLDVGNVNTAKFTAWKEGIINIYDQTLQVLIQRLSTRYNQKFILDDEVKEIRYTFTIKNESLDEIIELMEKITPVRAVQNQDTILIKLDMEKKKKVDG